MARAFTLASLRGRVRVRADLVNDHHITDAEIDQHISASYAALYEMLVQSGVSYFESLDTVTTSGAADGRYDLPADFLGTVAVHYQDQDRWIQLREIMPAEIARYDTPDAERAYGYRTVGTELELLPAPPTGQTYRLLYVPAPSDIGAGALGVVDSVLSSTITLVTATDAGNFRVGQVVVIAADGSSQKRDLGTGGVAVTVSAIDADDGEVTLTSTVPSSLAAVVEGDSIFETAVPDFRTLDGVSGWEEYVVLDAAIKCGNKQETSTTALERELERITKRIESAAEMRAIAMPRRVVAVTPENRGYPPLPGDWEQR